MTSEWLYGRTIIITFDNDSYVFTGVCVSKAALLENVPIYFKLSFMTGQKWYKKQLNFTEHNLDSATYEKNYPTLTRLIHALLSLGHEKDYELVKVYNSNNFTFTARNRINI